MNEFKISGHDAPVPKHAFASVVGSLKIRGTSLLFRAPAGVIKSLINSSTVDLKLIGTHISGIEDRKYRGACMGCRSKKFTIAEHGVKLDSEDRIVNARPLATTDNMI